MKKKQLENALDQVYSFYSQGDLNNAQSKSLEILQSINATDSTIINCSAEQSRLIGITFTYLALIADRNGNPLQAIEYYDRSIAYYQQTLSKTTNLIGKKTLEYDISGLFYNASVVYQNLKFEEKDGNNDLDKVKEYTDQERRYLYQASSGHSDTEEPLSDPMRHRLATIYYNLAKNYEADNESTDLTSSLNQAHRYYKLSLGFANKVSKQYIPEADVFTIEETRRDIKKAIRGIGNLLNISSEEPELDTSEKESSKISSTQAKAAPIPKKPSSKPEVRSVASVNNDITNGLMHLSRYVSMLNTAEDESRLWPHQKACLANISGALSQGTRHGFVNMATGTGKTTEFATLIKVMGLETIVVAPTNILVQQIAEEIRRKSPSLDVGTIDGTYKRKGNNVTVITYASFEKMHELDAFRNVKLIVLDEVHSSLSQKRINAIEHFKTPRLQESTSSSINNSPIVIGFTATDYFNSFRRSNDYTRVDELLPYKFFEYPIERGIDDKVLHPCKIVEIQLDDAINRDLKKILMKKRNKDATADLTTADLELLKQEEINRVITDVICNVSDPENKESLYGKSGLVFAIDIAHAESIASELNRTLGENYAASIHSQMTKKDQEIILAKHKSGEIKTLVNVDMLTVGYDDKQLKYIIDFRPTKSSVRLIQTFGRLTRKDDTNPEAKTYIQLVLPDMNLTASSLFHGRNRLGEIHTRTFDHLEEPAKDVAIGECCYYRVKFSNDEICERSIAKKDRGITTAVMKREAITFSSKKSASSQEYANIDWDIIPDEDWDNWMDLLAEDLSHQPAETSEQLGNQTMSSSSANPAPTQQHLDWDTFVKELDEDFIHQPADTSKQSDNNRSTSGLDTLVEPPLNQSQTKAEQLFHSEGDIVYTSALNKRDKIRTRSPISDIAKKIRKEKEDTEQPQSAVDRLKYMRSSSSSGSIAK